MKRILAILLLCLSLCACSSTLDSLEIKGDTDKTVASHQARDTLYVGNRSSLTYHLESCYLAKKMSEKNRYETYDLDGLKEKGFLPCKNCIDK